MGETRADVELALFGEVANALDRMKLPDDEVVSVGVWSPEAGPFGFDALLQYTARDFRALRTHLDSARPEPTGEK